jgi:hypothetical protein
MMREDRLVKLKKKKDRVISKEIIEKNLDKLIPYLSFFRAYPDMFVDMISSEDCSFSFFFYQRIFLRIVMRYKYVYVTFNRAFAKSFLSVMALYLKCIFYPGIKLFITAGGKEQATDIARAKIDEIWSWWPCLKNEILKEEKAKDYIKLYFKNGSQLDIMPAKETTRGQRRHGGLIDEVIMIDGEKLNRFVIPTMNVDRVARCGGIDPNENHKSQIYVTTAGHKTSFAYEKMLQLIVWMVARGTAFVWGGDYRIPMMHGLLSEDFVQELQEDGTYNEMDFSREYESIWSGAAQNAFFNPEQFDKHRVLQEAHSKYVASENTEIFYVLGIDVARLKAQTVIQVIKAIKRPNGYYKSLVNTFVYENRHFGEQAIDIKKRALEFNAKQIIIDGTGLGVGLLDFLVIENKDNITGEVLPPFAVTNDDNYNQFKKPDSLPLLYVVKPNDELNSQIYVNCLLQFNNGRIKLLADEKVAKTKLLNTKAGREMTSEQKAYYLMPFTYTSILKQEMMNLRQKTDGKYLKLEEVQKKGKDKFSAFVYGLWYVKLIEDQMMRAKKERKMTDFIMYN